MASGMKHLISGKQFLNPVRKVLPVFVNKIDFFRVNAHGPAPLQPMFLGAPEGLVQADQSEQMLFAQLGQFAPGNHGHLVHIEFHRVHSSLCHILYPFFLSAFCRTPVDTQVRSGWQYGC